MYYKGSWFLDAMRRAMGDRAFRAALHDYCADHRFGVATTADLIGELRAHSAAVTDKLLAPWFTLEQGE